MFHGSRITVIPVIPKVMMKEGQIPMRMKIMPRTMPMVTRVKNSAKRMPRIIVQWMMMRGTRMMLKPQKKSPALGSLFHDSLMAMKGLVKHFQDDHRMSPATSKHGLHKECSNKSSSDMMSGMTC